MLDESLKSISEDSPWMEKDTRSLDRSDGYYGWTGEGRSLVTGVASSRVPISQMDS